MSILLLLATLLRQPQARLLPPLLTVLASAAQDPVKLNAS